MEPLASALRASAVRGSTAASLGGASFCATLKREAGERLHAKAENPCGR